MRQAIAAKTSGLQPLLGASAGPVLIAGAAGLAVGAALAAEPTLVALLFGAALTAVGLSLAFSRPAVAFAGLVMLTVFVPSYAAPSIGPVLAIPAAAASWVLAVALGLRNFVERGSFMRPNVVDVGVGLFVLLMAISTQFSPRGTSDEFLHLMFFWAGPYLGCRILLAEVERPAQVLATSFALATAILAPLALFEYLGASNPFHNLDFNATEFSVWGNQADRFGQVRAEVSFGHPIALSMFAATSALLSLSAALNAASARARLVWFAAAGLAVAIQVLTVSRTGWLMMAIGIVLIVLLYARGANRQRLVALFVGAGVALLLASILVPSALQVLPGFQKSEAEVQSSGRYREALLDRALEPGVLQAWGNARNEVSPFVNFGTATDNAYIILADTWGLIPTAAMVFVALAMLWLLVRWRTRDREGLLALPVVAFTSLVALFFVAFITQQQVLIWLLLGAAGVAAERLADSRAAPAQRARSRARM